MLTSGKKAERRARVAVRSADNEYEGIRRRLDRPGISKAEHDYTYKMAEGALAWANKVRRANKRPPYGMSDEQWAEQRRAERELRYRDRGGFRRRDQEDEDQ